MKLMIEIPEELRIEITRIGLLRISDEKIGLIDRAIQCGTVLPEHGRLIDADALKKHKYHDSDRYENAVAVYHIDNAPTILESTKGDAE